MNSSANCSLDLIQPTRCRDGIDAQARVLVSVGKCYDTDTIFNASSLDFDIESPSAIAYIECPIRWFKKNAEEMELTVSYVIYKPKRN